MPEEGGNFFVFDIVTAAKLRTVEFVI